MENSKPKEFVTLLCQHGCGAHAAAGRREHLRIVSYVCSGCYSMVTQSKERSE